MRVLLINGPNLNRLGRRQSKIYGSTTLAEVERLVVESGSRHGVEVEAIQSNFEGEIIDAIHGTSADAILFNPGALSHTSRAIADAIRSVDIPTVEVHISNIREREPWRATSVISEACVRSIYGRGVGGYVAGLRHLVNRVAMPFETLRYGPHPEQVGDLRRGDDRGLVVLVHGGIWRHEYERDTIETLAVDLSRRGHATWNIGYRRFGAGGGWPGSGHDVLMALDFVPQLGLSAGPVVVIGHSAGGYLAIWAATRTSADLVLLVGLAPIVDLGQAVADDAVLAREAGLLLDHGAPAQVDPGEVSTIVVHGVADDIVPISQSRRLADRARIELRESGGGHFELLDPSQPHWEWVLERLTINDST